MARVAKALEQLRAQINARWPTRSKESDGGIGDAAHASRASDHNPTADGIVHARDFTHDPAVGFDSYAFADMLLAKQDKRISYIISNRRIGSGPGGPQPGKWRPYGGSNPHNHHVHVSVTQAGEDDTAPWDIEGVATYVDPIVAHPPAPPKTLRKGQSGPEIAGLQRALTANGATLKVDGDFGQATEQAVKEFQEKRGITADGVVGPLTRELLGKLS